MDTEQLRAEYHAIETQMRQCKDRNDPIRKQLVNRKIEIQSLLTIANKQKEKPKPALVMIQLRSYDEVKLQEFINVQRLTEEIRQLRNGIQAVLCANVNTFKDHSSECICEFCSLVRIMKINIKEPAMLS